MTDTEFRVSDLPSRAFPEPVGDLEAKLFGKKTIMETINQFEQEIGLSPAKKRLTRIKSCVIAPSNAEDNQLFEEILNNRERYSIIGSDKTWTVHGDYRLFLIYEEVIDKKKETKNANT